MDWKVHKHTCGKAKSELTTDKDDDCAGKDAVVDASVLQHHKRNFTFVEYDIDIEEEDLQGEEHNDEDSDSKDDSNKRDINKALKSSKINPDTIIWEDAGEDDRMFCLIFALNHPS